MGPPLQNLKSPRVGLIYNERMSQHDTANGERHLESPIRIKAIWDYLISQGITKRCVILNAKEVDDNQLAYIHTMKHIKLIRNISSKQFDSRRLKIASKYNSIYFNSGSSEAAYLAAGSVIEASISVARGDLNSAAAIVRPPGHHAGEDLPMGFCLFNNVAVAANVLLNERRELGIKKILIVDWDVHHGNGTQNAFYEDPRVLFFSVHRHDFGTFYPPGNDGSHCMTGEKGGAGYNINVPWEHGGYGDADYIAVWDHVLIPVTEAYNPDIILVSAGFDAAKGDPLGGCCVTPVGYSILLQKLMRFAGGKIILALEGGYNLTSISESVFACVETLLEDKPLNEFIEGRRPIESTRQVIQEVRNVLKEHWPVLASDLPDDLLSREKKREEAAAAQAFAFKPVPEPLFTATPEAVSCQGLKEKFRKASTVFSSAFSEMTSNFVTAMDEMVEDVKKHEGTVSRKDFETVELLTDKCEELEMARKNAEVAWLSAEEEIEEVKRDADRALEEARREGKKALDAQMTRAAKLEDNFVSTLVDLARARKDLSAARRAIEEEKAKCAQLQVSFKKLKKNAASLSGDIDWLIEEKTQLRNEVVEIDKEKDELQKKYVFAMGFTKDMFYEFWKANGKNIDLGFIKSEAEQAKVLKQLRARYAKEEENALKRAAVKNGEEVQ